MSKMNEGLDRNCVHLAGEYFAAAELSKRGYAIGITMGNAKAIDILVEKNARTANIQVKAIKGKTGWPIMRDKVVSNVVYIFVGLNEVGQPPVYSIMTPREVRANIKQYPTRGLLPWSVAMRDKYLERWDKVDKSLR